MRINATNSVGTIAITAVDEVTRTYTWEGATRGIELTFHPCRFSGDLGLYHDAQGPHWRPHHGIVRCFAEEGQQDFKTVDEAMKWIQTPEQQPCVYHGDGLAVVWRKLNEIDLNVKVWQILIDGKKPERLPASEDDKIIVDTVLTEIAPVVKAVQNYDLNAVKALLAKGADANAKNVLETPVLAMAIRQGSAPIVEALLQNHADPNGRDSGTDLPPLWDALKYLEPPTQNVIVKMLVAAGADVNAASRKDRDFGKGWTLLMQAALHRNAELVQLLLDKGADVNAKTKSAFTAISAAKLCEADDEAAVNIIKMLKAAGAKE
jgi:hypothetical protein